MNDYIFKLCSFLGTHMPLRYLYILGRVTAEIKYIFIYSMRRTVRKNVRTILKYREKTRGIPYTEAELSRTVKATYYNFSRYLADFFSVPGWDADIVKKRVTVENLELLDEGLKEGKGIVALTAHIGNWELAGIVTSMLGYSVTAVAIPYISPSVTKIYKEIRAGKGISVILTGSSPRGALKALKENRVLAVLGDKIFTDKGIETEFLGVKTLLPRGPATLAAKTGAYFTAGFFIMEDKGYRFFFRRIENPAPGMSEEEKINYLFTEGAKNIEDIILSYPEQWLNFSPLLRDG